MRAFPRRLAGDVQGVSLVRRGLGVRRCGLVILSTTTTVRLVLYHFDEKSPFGVSDKITSHSIIFIFLLA